MEGPFLYYQEILPSTNVTCSVFFSSYDQILSIHQEFLLTATGSFITIYRVQRNPSGIKLELKYKKKIFGCLQDVESCVKAKPCNTESDLIAGLFDKAKIVVFRYNSLRNEVEHIYQCNCEENAVGYGANFRNEIQSKLVVSPVGLQSCLSFCPTENLLCSLVYGRFIIFSSILAGESTTSNLPTNDTPDDLQVSAGEKAVPHFLCDLQDSLELTGPVIDMCCLTGYSRPVLAVLQQEAFLPLGHTAKVRNICVLTVLAVDLSLRTVVILWQKRNLPHDSLRLVPFLSCKDLQTCVAVISLNAVLVVSEGSAVAVALNSFAAVSVATDSISLQPCTNLVDGLELDASYWVEDKLFESKRKTSDSNYHFILGALKNGTFLKIDMTFEIEQPIKTLVFQVDVIASAACGAACSTLSTSSTGELLFAGSSLSDCLLLHAELQPLQSEDMPSADTPRINDRIEQNVFLSPLPSELVKKEQNGVDEAKGEDNNRAEWIAAVEKAELELYGGNSNTQETSSFVEYDLVMSVVDSIPVLGSVLHGGFLHSHDAFTYGDSLQWERFGDDIDQDDDLNNSNGVSTSIKAPVARVTTLIDQDAKDCMQISTGLDGHAKLCRVSQGVSLEKVSSKDFPGAIRVLTVDVEVENRYSILLVSFEERTQVFHCFEDKNSSEVKLIEISDDESGFIYTTGSLNLGIVHLSPTEVVAVQVTPLGLRAVRLSVECGGEGEALQDLVLADDVEVGGMGGGAGESILSGDWCAGRVVVLSSWWNVYLMKYDAVEESLEVVIRTNSPFSLSSAVSAAHGENALAVKMDVEESEKTVLDAVVREEVISVSLYEGVLSVVEYPEVVSEHNPGNETVVEINPVEMEERFLYGSTLKEQEILEKGDADSSMDVVPPSGQTLNSNNPSNSCNVKEVLPADLSKEVYLVLSEVSGKLSIVRVHDFKCVFQTYGFTKLQDFVPMRKLPENDEIPVLQLTHLAVETRLVRIGKNSATNYEIADDLPTLCLVVRLCGGDCVVYKGEEIWGSNEGQTTGGLYGFSKVEQRCVNNRRTNVQHLMRKNSETVFPPTTPTHLQRLPSSESTHDRAQTILSFLQFVEQGGEYKVHLGNCLLALTNVDGNSAVVVSGSDPVFIKEIRTMPQMYTLGFSELPFINYGHSAVIPFSLGKEQYFASLWLEFEDIDSLRNPEAANIRTNKPTTLGLFQLRVSQVEFPGSDIVVKQVHVGRTVHKCRELLNLTDDRTEAALLEKQTVLLSCSRRVLVPFKASVLSEEEAAEDDIIYERYFRELDSFCPMPSSHDQLPEDTGNPEEPFSNPFHAPPPRIEERSHELVLMQGGVAVDVHVLPPMERVLDVEVIYQNYERITTIAGMPMPIKTTARRVYVVVGTLYADKRGEDTQGNGRLLLFGLDYSLFQEDEGGPAAEEEGTEVKENVMDEENVEKKVDQVKSTAAQAIDQTKFLGLIKPKLRLQWSGPGPAGIVKQLGQYVLTTVGATIYVYRFNPAPETPELEQVAFYFTQIYVTSVSVMKNYIMVSDMLHCTQLLVWREEDLTLNFISKQYDPSIVTLDTSFMYNGTKVGMLAVDDEGNVQLLQQNARKLESIQGTRLLRIADFHLGSAASTLFSHELLYPEVGSKPPPVSANRPAPPPPPRTRKGSNFPLQVFGKRFNKKPIPRGATAVTAGTMDGGLGMFVPLPEKMYRRLTLLQQIMTMTVTTPFSLNAKDFRLYRSRGGFDFYRQKGILDGCLLRLFLTLTPSLQEEIAAAVGVTAFIIKENLREIEYLTRFF